MQSNEKALRVEHAGLHTEQQKFHGLEQSQSGRRAGISLGSSLAGHGEDF